MEGFHVTLFRRTLTIIFFQNRMGLLVHSHGSKYLGAREDDTFKANQEYLVNHFLRTNTQKWEK